VSVGEQSVLLQALPREAERPELHEDAAGFQYIDEPDETYVPPLLQKAPGGPAAPSLVLVDARAAVGKSMLARHLAWATGGPLWNLSGTYVGTGTLWGSLARAFGPQELNSVIGRTATGELVLIIDALDEAEMHAGAEAFDAFLLELRDMFAGSRPMPGAIILGRTETVDYVELFLGTSVPLSRYHISDFDRELAYRFVDRRLDLGKVSNPSFTPGAHRRREKLYEDARQRLFDFLIGRLLPDRETLHPAVDEPAGHWPARVGSFLGYAPVLEAIAEYLASYATNYPALLAELGHMEQDPYHSGNAQWNMLRTIVAGLLLREQEKVVAQARKVMPESAGIDWAAVYGPDEQCARVLGRVIGQPDLPESPPNLPSEVHARYRDVLKNAVPNHPFLGRAGEYANLVFRDYVHAWALRGQDTAARAAVRAELRSADYLPSPLLGPFILAGEPDGQLPVIEGTDVGFVYESLITHGDSDLYLYAEPNESASVFIGSDPVADLAVFEISRPDAGIQFWRRLSRARLGGEIAVQLGLPGRSFSIGPDVTIEGAIIEVPCRSVRVYTTIGRGVHLQASAGYIGGDMETELAKIGPGELTAAWDVVRYPWADYARPLLDPSQASPFGNDPAVREAFVLLCRVAQKFAVAYWSQRPLWGPVMLGTTIFHHVIPGTLLDSLSKWLTEQRIIFMRSQLYYLDARRLEEFGIRLFDLCTRTETPQALSLVQRFMADTGRFRSG